MGCTTIAGLFGGGEEEGVASFFEWKREGGGGREEQKEEEWLPLQGSKGKNKKGGEDHNQPF